MVVEQGHRECHEIHLNEISILLEIQSTAHLQPNNEGGGVDLLLYIWVNRPQALHHTRPPRRPRSPVGLRLRMLICMYHRLHYWMSISWWWRREATMPQVAPMSPGGEMEI